MAEFKVSTDLSVVRGLKINANFDELKVELTKKVESYRKMVVTPETTAAAKADLANLRRVQREIDAVRLAWKREYMVPWDEFEAKCKELKAVLDGGISNLDEQVKRFDEQEAEEKLNKLYEYFQSVQNEATRGFADWEKIKAAHPRWKNKTYDMVQAQNDIQNDLCNIERGLNAMRGYQEPYKSAMIEEFAKRYDLAAAINVYTQIKRREETEANLQRQREEAARRAAEEAARAKAQMEQNAQSAAQAARTAQELASAINSQMVQAQRETIAEARESAETVEEKRRVEIWVEVTKPQSEALGVFLRQNGIRYGKIRREG